jgi:uncharacterized protein YoaH (UPF0181 family)
LLVCGAFWLSKELSLLHWTRKTIVEHIKELHAKGEELNYTSAERNHLNLVRAAAWHFGTWRRAVESAGIDYESLSKYRRWSRERIVERIKELHAQGADLSWRAISTEVDPPLAAAALRTNGFPSWREAIEAAGLKIDDIARYKFWDKERVIEAIRELHEQGHPLSSKAMQSSNQSLFCAARRRFGSWDNALLACGLNANEIRLRKPKKPRKKAKGDDKVVDKAALNGHANGHAGDKAAKASAKAVVKAKPRAEAK